MKIVLILLTDCSVCCRMMLLPSDVMTHIYQFDPTFRIYFSNHILPEIDSFHSKCLCLYYNVYYNDHEEIMDCRDNTFQFFDKYSNDYNLVRFEEVEWNVYKIDILQLSDKGLWTSRIKKINVSNYPYGLYMRKLRNRTCHELQCTLNSCICTSNLQAS